MSKKIPLSLRDISKFRSTNFKTNASRLYDTVLSDPFLFPKGLKGFNSLQNLPFSTSPSNRLENSVLDKYKEKLKKKAESEGVDSIDTLLEKHFSKQEALKSTKAEKKEDSKLDTSPKQKKVVTDDASKASLDSIMKVDKLMELDKEAISKLWNGYHLSKESVSAAIPGATYIDLLEKLKKYPFFLFPIPREEGHEFYFMQSHFHQIYFTSLLEYKTHGSQARPHLIITHYPELIKHKDIVLMKGELGHDETRIPLTLDDAKLLVLQLQQFYIVESNSKVKLVEKFNKEPENFSYQELIKEAEILS